jgi:imidazolonepropionase-like amidohydrolase
MSTTAARWARVAVLAVCALALGGCRSGPVVDSGTHTQPTSFVRGSVFRPDGTTLDDGMVVVEGNRIVRVAPAGEVVVPPGVTVLGGADKWVLPGLIDAHVHFFQSGGLYTRPDVIDLRSRVPYAQELERIQATLPDTFRRYLRAGITSVVDFGGPLRNFETRALAERSPLAPRMVVAGPLLASVARPQLDLGDPPILQVTDPEKARAIVRAEASHKPDFIKLWWIVRPGGDAADWLPVARAAIEESHAAGLRVAVHATELNTARTAVLAGADVLVHSVIDADVDAEFIHLLRDRKVPLVTTLAVFEGYKEVLTHHFQPRPADTELASPEVVATVLEPFQTPENRDTRGAPSKATRLRNVRRLWDGGAIVAAGSDAGNIGTFHASGLHRELELLVESGLTPTQALTAATVNAAQVMRRADLGAIAPGMLADLLVLDANPLLDIHNARRIQLVMKDGVPHRPAELVQPTSTAAPGR